MRNLCGLGVLMVLISGQTVWGDVLPFPPVGGVFDDSGPDPMVVVLVGTLLTMVIAGGGLFVLRRRGTAGSGRGRQVVIGLASLVAIATVGLTIWAAANRSEVAPPREIPRRHRGPVRPRPTPLPESSEKVQPDQAPQVVEPSGPKGSDR